MKINIFKSHIILLLLTFTLAPSCIKLDFSEEEIFDSTTKVNLTTDWTNKTQGIVIPNQYTVSINNQKLMLEELTNQLPLQNAGTYRTHIYNTTDKIAIDGTTATVSTSADGVDTEIGWLFSSALDVEYKANTTKNYTAQMVQQVRQLTFTITIINGDASIIKSIDGELDGVGSQLNIDNNQIIGNASKAKISFTKSGNTFSTSIRLLGIFPSAQQKLNLILTYTDNHIQAVESNLSSDLLTFNQEKHKPLILSADLNLDPGAEFTGAISDWTSKTYTPEEIPMPQIDLASIYAGIFTMGSPITELGRQNDEEQHQVTLSKNFRISKYEITNLQYACFLNAESIKGDGSRIENGNSIKYVYDCTGNDKDNNPCKPWGIKFDIITQQWVVDKSYQNHPAIYVTWHGASAFAKWVTADLPTEAQWEYACRAGTTTRWHSEFDTSSSFYEYAWYSLNSLSTTHIVGEKKQNDWHLFDMHGNVEEWCADWYGAYNGNQTDPQGAGNGTMRVARGGAYSSAMNSVRSATRHSFAPEYASSQIGFRVVFNN